MALILHEIGDIAAPQIGAALAERGIPIEMVSSRALGAATRWEHCITGTAASVSVTLGSGRLLSSTSPEPMLNRLGFIPVTTLQATAGRDFGYAIQEVFALYMSWLHAWPGRVVNRPTPQGLCGNYRHPSVWATLAHRAGLPVRGWQQSERDGADLGWAYVPAEATAFAICGTVVLPAALPASFEAPCRLLAELAATDLLGIDFVRSGDGWALVGASPMPDLTVGGEPVIAALAQVLA